MTHEEKLQRIADKCRELLAIAEKRTAGKWNAFYAQSSICVGVNQPCNSIEDLNKITHIEVFGDGNRENDAAFIADCAGNAEAGWRITIAAIEICNSLRKAANNNGIVAESIIASVLFMENAIIAALEGVL